MRRFPARDARTGRGKFVIGAQAELLRCEFHAERPFEILREPDPAASLREEGEFDAGIISGQTGAERGFIGLGKSRRGTLPPADIGHDVVGNSRRRQLVDDLLVRFGRRRVTEAAAVVLGSAGPFAPVEFAVAAEAGQSFAECSVRTEKSADFADQRGLVAHRQVPPEVVVAQRRDLAVIEIRSDREPVAAEYSGDFFDCIG